jgi:hypothetical protein
MIVVIVKKNIKSRKKINMKDLEVEIEAIRKEEMINIIIDLHKGLEIDLGTERKDIIKGTKETDRDKEKVEDLGKDVTITTIEVEDGMIGIKRGIAQETEKEAEAIKSVEAGTIEIENTKRWKKIHILNKDDRFKKFVQQIQKKLNNYKNN